MDDHSRHATTSQGDRCANPPNDHVPCANSKDDPSMFRRQFRFQVLLVRRRQFRFQVLLLRRRQFRFQVLLLRRRQVLLLRRLRRLRRL
jgi:hypothetical protein